MLLVEFILAVHTYRWEKAKEEDLIRRATFYQVLPYWKDKNQDRRALWSIPVIDAIIDKEEYEDLRAKMEKYGNGPRVTGSNNSEQRETPQGDK